MTHEQFTQIYLPFSGKMYALAYNLLRNRDEARDCMRLHTTCSVTVTRRETACKMCTPNCGANEIR